MGNMPFIGIVFIDAQPNVWQTRVWADRRATQAAHYYKCMALLFIYRGAHICLDGQAIGRNETRYARRFAAGRHNFCFCRCVFGELWVFLPCAFSLFWELIKETRWNSSIQALCLVRCFSSLFSTLLFFYFFSFLLYRCWPLSRGRTGSLLLLQPWVETVGGGSMSEFWNASN